MKIVLIPSIGTDPKTVGFTKNLLKFGNKELFVIFSNKIQTKNIHELSINNLERIFSFYLAYLRGFRYGIVKLFEKIYLKKIIKYQKYLIKTFISVYPSTTVPAELKSKILSIFEEEKDAFLKEIRSPDFTF